MQQVPLSAEIRTILGRKVKSLRREGIVPAHVFGHKVKTVHVQVKDSDFKKVFEKVGETGIVELTVGGDKKPVLVRNVQIHPVTDLPLHIDFYQVNLSEKVKVDVPLEIVGQSPAVEKKLGLLLTPVTEIEIEALPTDLPESIEIDISQLANVGDEVKVKNLKVDKSKIEIHTDEELVVVQIGELVTKEMEAVEAEIEAEQAEVAEEKVAAAAAEGEPRPEGREGAEGEAAVEDKAEESEKAQETKEEAKPEESTEKPQ